MVTSKTILSKYKPYVVQSEGCKVLTTELARPIGIVSSFNHSQKMQPRTRAGKVAECVSIMPDGTRKVITSGAKFSSKTTVKPRRTIVVKEPTYRNNYEARLAMLGRSTEGTY